VATIKTVSVGRVDVCDFIWGYCWDRLPAVAFLADMLINVVKTFFITSEFSIIDASP